MLISELIYLLHLLLDKEGDMKIMLPDRLLKEKDLKIRYFLEPSEDRLCIGEQELEI